MPTELLTALPQLGGLVEKLGVIGLLLAVVAWLINDRLRLLKELMNSYKERDKARLKGERYRSELTAHSIAVPDTADIDLQFQPE
jgi:hypothetical protein